jgi:hypothetical protein
MKPDEFKIVLEDINEKFDLLIEGQNSIREELGRFKEENKQEHQELRSDILSLRKDLNEHRSNTELHVVRKKRKAS